MPLAPSLGGSLGSGQPNTRAGLCFCRKTRAARFAVLGLLASLSESLGSGVGRTWIAWQCLAQLGNAFSGAAARLCAVLFPLGGWQSSGPTDQQLAPGARSLELRCAFETAGRGKLQKDPACQTRVGRTLALVELMLSAREMVRLFKHAFFAFLCR